MDFLLSQHIKALGQVREWSALALDLEEIICDLKLNPGHEPEAGELEDARGKQT